ncbi:hypothetical protein ACFQ45_00455 [Rhodanobacter aciditrophus]|uniref:Outer membrane protein beta-barrel domain-containing protein n=1 Tax=Rhodanobacter aciditrophus TaxID=1623218 RepID=A0ABW4AX64_9GAMM
MKKLVSAALLAGATSASAAGQFSSLASYDYVFSKPSTATSHTASVINTLVEYTYPRTLSIYGGFSFILRDSFESTLTLGARLYTPTPMFYWGGSVPIWSYVGAGTFLLDNGAYYPEAGLRIGITNNTRLDVFLKVFNSDDTAYDKHATIGVGLTF